MSISVQVGRMILLFSLAALLLPLTVFPNRFGTSLVSATIAGYGFEIVYYALVAFLLHRRTTLLKLAQVGIVCLVFRVALGAMFGLIVAARYSMNVGISLQLGVVSYLPVLLFHIAATPWILKPVIDSFYRPFRRTEEEPSRQSAPPVSQESGRTSIAVSRERAATASPAPERTTAPHREAAPKETPSFDSPAPSGFKAPKQPARPDKEPTGFDRAVNYIGEHGSVHLAAVVDDEGLLLSNFCRGQWEAEDWAPLALVALERNAEVMTRIGLEGIEKLDFNLRGQRVVVARAEGYCLTVVSERHDDDLLSIRINQALEMINKFVAERYGDKLNTNVERAHVSSAQ